MAPGREFGGQREPQRRSQRSDHQGDRAICCGVVVACQRRQRRQPLVARSRIDRQSLEWQHFGFGQQIYWRLVAQVFHQLVVQPSRVLQSWRDHHNRPLLQLPKRPDVHRLVVAVDCQVPPRARPLQVPQMLPHPRLCRK